MNKDLAIDLIKIASNLTSKTGVLKILGIDPQSHVSQIALDEIKDSGSALALLALAVSTLTPAVREEAIAALADQMPEHVRAYRPMLEKQVRDGLEALDHLRAELGKPEFDPTKATLDPTDPATRMPLSETLQ